MRGGVVLWSLMVSAPALLLGVMGIVGRTQVSTWEFESYSPKENLALLSYQVPMQEASRLRHLTAADQGFEQKLNTAVELWLSRHDSGELTDVLPGAIEDQGSSGIKGQISESRQILINSLHLAASASQEKEDDLAYCMAHAKIVRVSDIGKYSGVATIQQGSLMQIGSLRRIAYNWSGLNSDEKEMVRQELAKVRRTDAAFMVLAERLSHLTIRRQLTNNVSMKDMSTVFHASKLASLMPPANAKLSDLNEQAKTIGLDPFIGVTLAASLKSEDKFRTIIEDVLNPASTFSGREPWLEEQSHRLSPAFQHRP